MIIPSSAQWNIQQKCQVITFEIETKCINVERTAYEVD